MNLWDPWAPAADLVPWDAYAVTPTDAEARIWREVLATVGSELACVRPNLRVIWYQGGDPDLRGQTLHTRPPVILLRAGRRLGDLRRTCVHEVRHLWQLQFSDDAWSVEEREADAVAFAERYTR